MIRLCAFADEASGELEGQIRALERNGISLLEIRNVNGKNVIDLTDEEVAHCRELLDSHGIRVFSIGSPLGKAEIDTDFDEYCGRVERTCRIANLFGCENIRVFSFYHAYDKRDVVIAHLKAMAAIAQRYGVHLCHENEKEIYGDTPQRMTELLDAVDGLCAVFDPANFVQVGVDTSAALDVLASRCRYFHIKDVIAETGEIVPAGEGDGSIEKLLSMVTGDRVLTLEPHLTAFSGYASIDSTELKNKYRFASNDESFDAAAAALKGMLARCGYREENGGYCK